MKRADILTSAILAFSLCAAQAVRAADDQPSNLQTPTTIFATKIGDADLDFNLSGSWDATISYSTGLLIVPGLPVRILDAFPAMEAGFYFQQIPDLTASIVLMKKYFVDLSVVPDSSQNRLTMGYRGDSTETIRSVIIGNGGVTIPSSDFLEIPEQPPSSLGASVLLVSGISTNEFLLRWDSAEEKTKLFMGESELLEETVSVESFIRGRFFYLPDTNVDESSLQLFLEDENGTYAGGDGKKYRLAAVDDASLDAASGLVSLKSAVKGRVLVYYTKGGAAVGSGTLGTGALPNDSKGFRDPALPARDFSFGMGLYLGELMSARQIAIGSKGCLLLWEPGDTSPFEFDASYAFTNTPPSDPSRIQIKLQEKGAGGIPSEARSLSFQSYPDEKRFVVFLNKTFRSNFRNMYPFPDVDGLIYGPPKDSLAGYLGYQIEVQMLTNINEYVLEPNIVPGSVRVTVNGVTETRFTVDPESGRVTFNAPIHTADRIEMRYKVSSAGLSGGDILFAWRDTLAFSDAMKLTIAAGVRWNADPAAYSIKPYQKSGTIIAATGLEGKDENWSYAVKAGVAYTNPDTSGVLRLFGMEGNSLEADLSENNVYPAALPETPDMPPGLSQNNRGYLFYRDYRSYDAFGGASLHTIGWPSFTSRPYDNGGRMGPYNVLGDAEDSDSGQSLVFDFQLQLNEWVGAQLPPTAAGSADLSSARSVTLRYRTLNVSGPFQVFLQIGRISEDIDGESGGIKHETSATDPGFDIKIVKPGPTDITMKVGDGPKGEGNGRLDTEDRDSNKILDDEDPGKIYSIAVGTYSSDTPSWQRFKHTFSDAERSLLMNARQVRIVIVPSGAPSTGKFLIDSLTFEGAAENGSSSGGTYTELSVRETPESMSVSDPGSGNRLQDKFSDVKTKYHSGGEIQEVLEAVWTNVEADHDFTITGYTSRGTGGIQYDTISLFLRIADPITAGSTMDFALKDIDGRGISWSMDPNHPALSDGAWHEIRASKNGKVRVDGTVVGGSTAVFDSGYDSLAKFTLTVSNGTNPHSGTIFLDEITCQDPEGVVGASFNADVSYQRPGPIVQSGDFTVLGDFSVRQKLSVTTEGFSTLYGVPAQQEDLFSDTELGADALLARWKLNLLLRDYGGSLTASGGHRVTAPSVPFPVAITDAFSLTTEGEFSRENILEIKPAEWLSAALDSSAEGIDIGGESTGTLSQDWGARIDVSPIPPLSIGSQAALSQALSGYPLPQRWYGESWVHEMSRILPWSGGDDVSRREELDLTIGLRPDPFGFQTETKALAKSTDFTDESRDQENDFDMSLTLTMKLGGEDSNGLTFSLGYRRYVTIFTNPPAGERFISEAQSYGDVMSRQDYLFSLPPFAELFQDNSSDVLPRWTEAYQAVYSPRATLGMQRDYGPHLYDLFLPSSVDVAVGQDLKKDGVLSSTQVYISPKVTTHAINLFGQLGAYPLMRFAKTDEYGISFATSLTASPGRPYRCTETTVELFASIEGFNEEQLAVTQTFTREQLVSEGTLSVTDTTQILFGWTSHPAGGFPIPILPADIGSTGYFSHKETAEFSFRFAEPDAYHPFTIVLGHSSTLVYPSHGSIMAGLDLGFDMENLGGGLFAYRVGFQAQLQAKLTF